MRGGDLHDLLVAPLHRAVAFEEVDRVAGAVGEDLDLDVTGMIDEPLDEDGAVAEGGLGFTRGSLEGLGEGVRVAHHPHPAAAAAHGRLDDDREAGALGEGDGLVDAADRPVASGYDGHALCDGELAGGRLVAEGLEHLGGRSHEGDARVLAGPG